MRSPVHIIPLLMLVACGDARERAAEDALFTGNRHYKAGRMSDAVEAYAAGIADARVAHNAGLAHMQLGAWDLAVEAFTDAAPRLPDTAQQAMAWYHTGHARLRQAIAADSLQRAHAETLRGIRIEGEDVALNVSRFVLRDSLRRELRRLDLLIDSALVQGEVAYKRALRLAPADDDARHDLTLVRHLASLRPSANKGGDGGGEKDPQDTPLGMRAQVIIQQADSLVDAYRFKEALALLQQGLREDPSLQQRKEYMDKLDLVSRSAEAE